ncbi:unnamed protein product [Ophioblennius macclurei]
MALQDFCRFPDNLGEATTATRPSSLPFGERTPATQLTSPFFGFFVPTADFLDQSPLQISSMHSCFASGSSSSPAAPPPFPMSHGTTTLAFAFQGGVLAAADTRSSCAGQVACPAAHKVLPIHRHLLAAASGTSADCALWRRILARELRLYQLRHGRRLSTGGAAKLLSHMLHPFKGTQLCVAATLCGWDGGSRSEADDAGQSGPRLVYVCSDGTHLKGALFSVGSGSPYAYAILDQGVQWGLSVEQAVALAREAVYRAAHRDAYSGNCVDVFHLDASGWCQRDREDLKEEYHREQERRSHGRQEAALSL